jgi:ATP-binding cassette subfamily F protein 3
MRLENVSHSYDSSGWVLENVNLSIERGEKIGFIGFNGTGKTTLLKIMAGRFAPSKGKVITGHKVITGYQAQEFGEILPIKSTAYDVVKAIAPPTASPKGIRAVLGMFGFSGESAEKPCSVLSGGEKIRLCFARIFINPPNFLILDEPTTHLDIAAREALQKAVKQYNGTVCIVSHDIEFIRNSVSTIIAMSPPGVTKFYGGYDYYREKTAAVPEILSQTESSGQTDNTSFSVKKERRRERAEKRAGMLKIKKTAEKTLMKIEEKTERLEAEKKEITEKLINASEAVDFASLSRGIKEINGLIESATEEWEKAALELEEIEEKYESIHN